MADMTPILIKDLVEQTTAADTDYMVIGGADAKKIKWSTIWGLIRDKLGIGKATLATNDKTVKGAINELNTKMNHYDDYIGVAPGNQLLSGPLYIYPGDQYNQQHKKYFLHQPPTGARFPDMPSAIANTECILFRDVFYRGEKNILVRMLEAFPEPGRVWYNAYNSGSWSGWILK